MHPSVQSSPTSRGGSNPLSRPVMALPKSPLRAHPTQRPTKLRPLERTRDRPGAASQGRGEGGTAPRDLLWEDWQTLRSGTALTTEVPPQLLTPRHQLSPLPPSPALPQPWQTQIHVGTQPRPLCRSGGAGTSLDPSSWSPPARRGSCAPAKSQPTRGEPLEPQERLLTARTQRLAVVPDQAGLLSPACTAGSRLYWAPAWPWLSPITDLHCQVHTGRRCSQRVHASSQGAQLLIGARLVLAPAPGHGPAGHACLRQCYMSVTSQ